MLKIKIKKVLLWLMLSVPYGIATADCCDSSSACSSDCDSPTSQNLWQPHAFSNYASQEILIMKGLDLDATEGKWLNRFGFVTEYMQNFGHNCRGLGAMPFWSGTNTMTIGTNDGLSDLDAYQFGLGNVITPGTITLNPRVQHIGTELMWYGMQNEDKVGAYVKIKVPLGAMRITTNLCEKPAVLSDDVIDGYFLPALRYDSMTEAFHGGTNLQDPLYTYGLVAECAQSAIRFGDITAAVGVNFVAKENALFGAAFKVSCPTGNVPKAIYMLEPIFGRAGHWGVGGEIQGHYRYDLKDSDCGAQYVSLWVQAEAMHLFSGRKPSWRSFDLRANGKGSKYLLLQHYHNSVDPGHPGAPGTPEYVSDYVIPAINVTTLPVNSVFAVEGNFALMVDYVKDGWNLSLGGDLWARSGESLSINCCSNDYIFNDGFVDYNLNDYAVLGRQEMDLSGATVQTWCEPLARINNSQAAYTGANPPEGIKDAALAENRIPSSYNEALDICGAQADRIFTGKVLGEIGYTWTDNCHVPHVSIFGAGEFSAKSSNWVNLWSVGLQGSLQF